MKNICFIYTDITTTGGIERCISLIANKLANSGEYNVNIISIKRDGGTPFFSFDDKINISYLYNKEEKRKKMITIKRIREFLKKNKIETIIVANVALEILITPAILGMKIKHISWEHFGFSDEMSNKYIDIARRISVKLSDYVVVLTQHDKNEYLHKYRIGKKTQLKQIYNPIVQNDYERDFKENKKILTIGHFLPVKGYDFLIEIAKEIFVKYPEWSWTIIGDGENKKEFENKIIEYKLENKITIKSKIKDVNRYYESADIYVNTSRSEGFALTILEARTYELPVVAFNIPGMDEIVENNVNGILVEKFNVSKMIEALEKIIIDKDLRKKYSINAKNNLEMLDIDNIIKKWKKII